MSDTLTPVEADHAMRNWVYRSEGRIRIGSEMHKRMFCEMLLTTHNPYKPAVIEWPKLDPAALRRVTSLPIWDIAVQTEGRASIRVATYAASVADPQLNEALRMNGGEEARHKLVLSKLVAAYGIELAPEPPYPAPTMPCARGCSRATASASTVSSRSVFSRRRDSQAISPRRSSRPSSR